MSGPSITDPSQVPGWFVNSDAGDAELGINRSGASGTDQIVVLMPMWLPSDFQMSQDDPDESLKMSGSMLPP